MLPPQSGSDEPYFTQQTGGLTWGLHCEECSTPLGNRGRLSPGFIGKSRSQVIRRILRTCRENIAYNTLQYNFARMLLLPRVGPLKPGPVVEVEIEEIGCLGNPVIGGH